MPSTVQQLIEGCPKPVTVSPNDPVKRALDLMIEHDFSQLPVVDDSGRPLGMVTSDSIIRSLSNFGVTIDALRVSNAMVRAVKFRPEDDLFGLLDDLRDSYSALIVDGDGRLTGVVTSYDTTEFFRRRAEDIMLVEDIESALKEHVQAAFTNEKGDTDQTALAAIIEQVTQKFPDCHLGTPKVKRMYQIDSTSEHNSVKAWPILANLACWGSQSWPQTENRETFGN
jgi:CBS domain-containing protein